MSREIDYLRTAGVSYRWPKGEQRIAQGKREFRYDWLHIPTGKMGVRSIFVLGTRADMLELVNYWNLCDGNWRYRLA